MLSNAEKTAAMHATRLSRVAPGCGEYSLFHFRCMWRTRRRVCSIIAPMPYSVVHSPASLSRQAVDVCTYHSVLQVSVLLMYSTYISSDTRIERLTASISRLGALTFHNVSTRSSFSVFYPVYFYPQLLRVISISSSGEGLFWQSSQQSVKG